MLFGKHTTRKTVWMVVALSVSVPFAALGAPSTEDLSAAKNQFDSLWHMAAETTKRKATLEQTLASFDSKVASAKQDLEKATSERLDVRQQIANREKLIAVLKDQLHAAAESRGFYEAVAGSQKEDIVAFIRYLSGKQLAVAESGPVVGGSLLKHILRGSLGESIDASIADTALLKTREHFALQIGVLVSEADKAEARIRGVLGQLTDEVDGLQEKGQHLSDTVQEQTAFIDDSWRLKQLTESELKSIVRETAEVDVRIRQMQTSLLTINAELKDEKSKQLKTDLADLQSQRQTLMDRITAIERKDQAMSFLETASDDAFALTEKLKGSDKKLYKRIEDVQLRLKQLQAGMPVSTDSGADLSSEDSMKRSVEIAELTEQIALMKTGVPEDAAAEYVHKKRLAFEATETRREFASERKEINKKLLALDTSIASKQHDLELARQSNVELSDVPPMFSWPVHGPITAGYYDPDYQKVFNVPHRAIDIAVPQATPIHSVSEGIVFAVKDGGRTGYSYILIGHEGGYASLYGHVSASFVQAGDKVGYQQIIGLTGGEPGSHGAGPMTTGSHLHLEMMKNGEHVNPLSVLSGR